LNPTVSGKGTFNKINPERNAESSHHDHILHHERHITLEHTERIVHHGGHGIVGWNRHRHSAAASPQLSHSASHQTVCSFSTGIMLFAHVPFPWHVNAATAANFVVMQHVLRPLNNSHGSLVARHER
jgi:hypothetical protein